MTKNIIKYAAVTAFVGLLSACSDDFFTSEPGDIITSDQMENVDPAAGLNGMYAYMYKFDTMGYGDEARHDDYGYMNTVLCSELWGQDMVQYSDSYSWYYGVYQYEKSSRQYEYLSTFFHWNFFYKLIKATNDVLRTTSDDTKEARGEALGMRAFAYLNLVQLYQLTYKGHEEAPAIPLVLETSTEDELANNPRASVTKIYEQIEKDLLQAHADLTGYTRKNKTIIDQAVVAGFLARMYLNKEEWTDAAKYANEARSTYGAPEGKEELIDEGYIDMNKHHSWMWTSDITIDADIVATGIVNYISHISSTAYGYVTAGGMFKNISANLYDKIADNDIRKGWWCAEDMVYEGGPMGRVELPQYANLKYGWYNEAGDNCNDYVYMRAEEMWLIEAEALTMGGNIPGGKALLEQFVKTRQPDYTCTAASADAIRDEIWLQRRIEFWGEGVSWFDLKRLKKPIQRKYTGTNHNLDAQYDFPAEDNIFNLLIPRKEIQDNNGIKEEDNNPMPNI